MVLHNVKFLELQLNAVIRAKRKIQKRKLKFLIKLLNKNVKLMHFSVGAFPIICIILPNIFAARNNNKKIKDQRIKQ